MTQLERAAREVVEAARRLDFYAAWIPMIDPDSAPSRDPDRLVPQLRKRFDAAIWALRDAIGGGR